MEWKWMNEIYVHNSHAAIVIGQRCIEHGSADF